MGPPIVGEHVGECQLLNSKNGLLWHPPTFTNTTTAKPVVHEPIPRGTSIKKAGVHEHLTRRTSVPTFHLKKY